MEAKLNKIFKEYYKIIIVFICLLGIIGIICNLFSKNTMKIDTLGYRLISNLISDKTIPIAKAITNFGGTIGLIIINITVCIVLALNKNKIIGYFILLNTVISLLLNQVLKRIVQRPRPTGYRLIEETGYSFPSGHSMVSMAFYGFCIYLIFRNVKNKYIKYGSIILLSLLIILIGMSRIYLGVHYTSDVIAGYLASIAYLTIFIDIVNNYLYKKDNN